MMNTTKTGLLPEEDMGQVMVNITMPPGSSLAQTSAAIRELEKRIDSIPEMAVASATAGYGLIGGAGPSSGMIMGQLTDWSERKGEGQGIDDVLAKVYGPESLFRFNLYSAMGINGEAAQGYSSGDAINAIRETADKVLPRGYSFEFAGLSREESQTTNNTAIIFLICTVFVYLILCGLYESFFVPFSVILAVPFGLMGSFLFAKLMGLENNIYMQTGLIMLIGLLSKTAILLTEYASERRRAAGCAGRRQGASAPDHDDHPCDDIRAAASDVRHRCRGQRQLFAGVGSDRRNDIRYIGNTVFRTGILLSFPVYTGTCKTCGLCVTS